MYKSGKVENNVYIIDMADTSILSLPLTIIKELGIMMEKNYRTKMYRIYIVNAPLMMSALMGVMKYFDSNIQQKIFTSRQTSCKEIFEHVNPSQLEKNFGGLKENLSEPFWPIQYSVYDDDVFINEEDKKKCIHLS
mgnify:CR=1 FL=1